MNVGGGWYQDSQWHHKLLSSYDVLCDLCSVLLMSLTHQIMMTSQRNGLMGHSFAAVCRCLGEKRHVNDAEMTRRGVTRVQTNARVTPLRVISASFTWRFIYPLYLLSLYLITCSQSTSPRERGANGATCSRSIHHCTSHTYFFYLCLKITLCKSTDILSILSIYSQMSPSHLISVLEELPSSEAQHLGSLKTNIDMH